MYIYIRIAHRLLVVIGIWQQKYIGKAADFKGGPRVRMQGDAVNSISNMLITGCSFVTWKLERHDQHSALVNA